MSFGIKIRLQDYIRQEQALLEQLFQLRKQHKDIGTEISKAVISEGVAVFAKELLESSMAGKYGRRFTKAFINQKQKEQLSIQERSMENQHDSLVQSARSFLDSISLHKKGLKEPNSSKLVEKLDKAQEFAKVETRIRKTVTALQSIVNKPLIYNKDIQTQPTISEVIISPGEPFSGSLKLKEILKGVQGYAEIIDPYVDETILEFLISVPKEIPIKILTANTGGEEKERQLKKACQRFKTERPQFAIRKCEPKLIHDRFILTQTQGWSIGTSLKDIGKKLSMIKEISPETRSKMDKIFEEVWDKSLDLT